MFQGCFVVSILYSLAHILRLQTDVFEKIDIEKSTRFFPVLVRGGIRGATSARGLLKGEEWRGRSSCSRCSSPTCCPRPSPTPSESRRWKRSVGKEGEMELGDSGFLFWYYNSDFSVSLPSTSHAVLQPVRGTPVLQPSRYHFFQYLVFLYYFITCFSADSLYENTQLHCLSTKQVVGRVLGETWDQRDEIVNCRPTDTGSSLPSVSSTSSLASSAAGAAAAVQQENFEDFEVRYWWWNSQEIRDL